MTDALPALRADTEIVDAELIDGDGLDLAPAVLVGHVDINLTLTPEAAEAMANSGRENTRRTYTERWRAFANWCAQNGRKPGPPTTEHNLISYVDALCRRDVDPGTVRLTIAAIRDMNARAGHPDTPNQDAALQRYADHRYAWNAAGKSQQSAPPLDLDRIRQMLAVCPADTLTGLRDQVLLLLGYYMRARRSELAKLRCADVQFVSPDLIVAVKRVSKNDKDSDGKEYEIDDPTAIAVVRQWFAALAERGQKAPHLPLLRSVDRWENLGTVNKRGQGITPVAINNAVQRIARRAELDVAEEVTAHGLRAGVPTDLGAEGYSAAEIKDLTGDWGSTKQVEKYRKIGRRRAGMRTDEGRRSTALSMLRVQPKQPEQPESGPA